MDVETVRGYFNDPRTVDHYMKAVGNVGLWESEEAVIGEYFDVEDDILDLGCGAGRIAIGLAKSGYRRVRGADLAEGMVARARDVAGFLDCSVAFERQDATAMTYDAGRFDGVIFGFNGLMQIPAQAARALALREIFRVLKAGGVFVFTTLDRDSPLYKEVFLDQTDLEHCVERNAGVVEFGDRHFEHGHGTTFMHVPIESEVKGELEAAGFALAATAMRSEICPESETVEDFSEDCRFWVAKKPVA